MQGIFISYSRVDRSIAAQIAAHLRHSYGYERVWFDENLRAGQSWWEEIQRQIEHCDVFILLMSPESMASQYCMLELEEARRLKRWIVPVLVRDRTSVPPELRSLHRVTMTDGITVSSLSDLQAAMNHHQRHKADRTLRARPAAVTIPALSTLIATRPARWLIAGGNMNFAAVPSENISTHPALPLPLMSLVTVVVLLLAVGITSWRHVVLTGTPIKSQYTAAVVQTTATPSPAPVVQANPASELVLFYDDVSLTLVNAAPTAMNVSDLVFSQQGDAPLTFEGNTWNNGSPLGLLQPGECVQVWTMAVARPPVPSVCKRRVRWRQASKLYTFWRGAPGTLFEVRRGETALTVCVIGESLCSLPPLP